MRTRITSSGYGGSVLGGTLITGFLTIIGGPIGFIAGVALTGAAIKDTYDSAKATMDKEFTEEDERKLREAYRGSNKFKVKVTSHKSANNPPASRLLFGNNVTKTCYYEEED